MGVSVKKTIGTVRVDQYAISIQAIVLDIQKRPAKTASLVHFVDRIPSATFFQVFVAKVDAPSNNIMDFVKIHLCHLSQRIECAAPCNAVFQGSSFLPS